ncbi:MAG: aldolase/citrate lyase family protein [Acidobacteria bacterium]|nr:aldolase/citrate lyase family protein [Acidobacteriota bacterium]
MDKNWVNPVKQKLAAGLPVVAGTIQSNSIDSAAHLATLSFDFLWVEMEHSPITLETLRNIVLATRGRETMTFARVPVNEIWMAKRVLDAGVSGVIFPFTSSPELARQAVAACKYPPVGRRGSGAGLAKLCWPDTADYTDSADANTVVICMIEEACAVEQIDEIAATPGLDVLFIGTSDLSFSYGKRGDQNDPLVLEAVEKVIAAGKRHGKAVGRPAASAQHVQQYLQQGFQVFQAPSDISMMMTGAQQYLQPLGKKAAFESSAV